MNYAEYKQYVADHIKEYLPPEYEGYEVSIIKQRKTNNVLLDALHIKGEHNVVPALYLESCYQDYCKEVPLEKIMSAIADAYVEGIKHAGEFSSDRWQYEKLKDDIFVVAQNAEMNQDMLKDVPHEIRDDFALIYRVEITLSNGERGSAIITNDHINSWGIDGETLKETAWNNMRESRGPVICSMSHMLEELGCGSSAEETEGVEMYVLTSKGREYGAAYVFDKVVMNYISDELGADLIVLPSSIHEGLLLVKTEDLDFDELRRMVREVNRAEVLPTEFLSDEVYLYDRKEQCLSRVPEIFQEMPDVISEQQMHEYGYRWKGMLPITKERAMELAEEGLAVFRLYEDGTEGMVIGKDEFSEHDGMYGVEKLEWSHYLKAGGQEQAGEMTQQM